MFVGREAELAELNQLLETKTFQFPVVYGRRRVGKTRLITEFIKNKKAVYFSALESSMEENLRLFSREILALESSSVGSASYANFEEAFDAVLRFSKESQLIVVIDEYPYLAESYPAISSLLQNLIDHKLKNSNLFLILCGSSLSFMEEQVLGYKSPLYGRRTAQLKIRPLNFYESSLFFERFSLEEKIGMYACLGGIPSYLELVDDTQSFEHNIKQLFLKTNSFLFEEANNFLLQECRTPAQYNAIMQAIASGSSRHSEISSKAHIASSNATTYLNRLITLEIVKRELPLGETSNKKALYCISDNFFSFWYRFIPDNTALVQGGFIDEAYNRIKEGFSAYVGIIFEEVCKQFLLKEAKQKNLPVLPVRMGRWWGTDSRKKEQVEIDIIVDNGKDQAVFAECKWRNEKTDEKVLRTLIERSELFSYKKMHYYLFSKSGFTDGCKNLAADKGNVTLVALSSFG